jgi:hypothetical protein
LGGREGKEGGNGGGKEGEGREGGRREGSGQVGGKERDGNSPHVLAPSPSQSTPLLSRTSYPSLSSWLS